MIFDTYVGKPEDIRGCAKMFSSGPMVERVKHFNQLEQLLDVLKRDEHYLNIAVICGNYNAEQQKAIKASIKRHEPKATVVFYDPHQ